VAERVIVGGMICKLCGGPVTKAKVGSKSLLFSLAMFITGLIIFILIPVIGWVLGGVMMIVALLRGGSSKRVLRCRSCKAIAAELA